MPRWLRFERRVITVLLLIAAGCIVAARWSEIDAAIQGWCGGVPTRCPDCGATLDRDEQPGAYPDGSPCVAVWLHCPGCGWTPTLLILEE